MQWLTSREAMACAVAGLLGAACAYLASALDPVAAAACGVLLALATAIAIIDARAFIIPDKLLIPMGVAGLAARLAAVPEPATLLECLLGASLAGGAFYLLRYVYGAVRKREGLGLGDVKLAAVAGLWLPLALLPLWVLAAALAALLATLIIGLASRGKSLSAATVNASSYPLSFCVVARSHS